MKIELPRRFTVLELFFIALLLGGWTWLNESLRPSAAHLGEIGNSSIPFGAANIDTVDAGTLNVNSIVNVPQKAATGSRPLCIDSTGTVTSVAGGCPTGT